MQPIQSEADIERGLSALLASDPRLEAIAAGAGPLPLRLAEPGFGGLAYIIVSQMVSRASATAIWSRLAAAMGTPTPETYLGLGEEALACGLSRAKYQCLTALCEAIIDGSLDPLGVLTLPAEEAIATLCRIRGIGLWTSEVYLMFCGGHPDIFPAGDVALRIALGQGLGFEERPDIRKTAAEARAWQPWRSVAARLFWAYYASLTHRDAAPTTSV
ncbi:DNA-3-methyladenine glycosylase family protein [Rhizobium paknamense]|uniref:DNA-3-methyladenine glycosylase II n=1 Tax=Rhizobium paknamense TaxID=1206817 RepID=A0ABU0IE57_9HYPH|nr:DNA-3-methyladenine glycosylase 2 family protein [Rhizobium paknamense]MDQ0456526.1 DNA-3-methyladenine glycosylase II [Rhizobium paknamense]